MPRLKAGDNRTMVHEGAYHCVVTDGVAVYQICTSEKETTRVAINDDELEWFRNYETELPKLIELGNTVGNWMALVPLHQLPDGIQKVDYRVIGRKDLPADVKVFPFFA